ncbi:uncharacterized protein LOC142980302 [Anticarsia gemmatalis]|uniref:uncharacterized protein LOC142980302 n=1 Tax=Anticarsia gemmatalis TaxID=129554 RepID=UPI003F76201F
MKLLCVVTLVVFAAVAESLDVDLVKNYKFENIFDPAQDALRKEYFACMLDKGPCNGDLQKLKENIVEIVKTNCGECPVELQQRYADITQKFQKEYPDELHDFMSKVLAKK